MNALAGFVDRRLGPVIRTLLHYGYAAMGPIGSAGAQFLLALLLLHALSPQEFGSFSFLLVASNFCIGVWSALFCAPLPVLVGGRSEDERAAVMTCLHTTCLMLSVVVGLVFVGLGVAIGNSYLDASLFAVFVGANLVRWFARSNAYVLGETWRAVASDNLYAILLVASVVAIHLAGSVNLTEPYVALVASVLISFVPFGRAYLKAQFMDLSARSLASYRNVWREHSRWSLLGVISTEATANAHAYVVTLLSGPAVFAPISAAALLMRPMAVLQNAFVDFERPRIARKLNANDLPGALAMIRSFRFVLIAAWVATVLAAVVILLVAPHVIFPPKYPLDYLVQGAALWMAVAGIRMLRLPESALMQAGGVFRELAFASVVSSAFSVIAVVVLIIYVGPLWSVAGIFVGELVCAIWIWRETRRWLERRKAAETA